MADIQTTDMSDEEAKRNNEQSDLQESLEDAE